MFWCTKFKGQASHTILFLENNNFLIEYTSDTHNYENHENYETVLKIVWQ